MGFEKLKTNISGQLNKENNLFYISRIKKNW